MPWFKVDDNLAFHAKTVSAGNPAMRLWVRAGSWAAQQITDGFIPDHIVSVLGTMAQARTLVKVRLWDQEDGGFRFHEWTDRQPRKADIEAERAAARERMRAARALRKGRTAVSSKPKSVDVSSEQNDQENTSSQVSESRSGEHGAKFGRSSGEVRETFALPDPVPIPVPSRPDQKTVQDLANPEPPAGVNATPNSGNLIAEWISHCEERPPSRVIGQVSKEIKTMLDEGIDYERVRSGLAEWNRKGLHPSTIASVVHEVANKAPRTATADQRVAAGLSLVEQLVAEESDEQEQLSIGRSQ